VSPQAGGDIRTYLFWNGMNSPASEPCSAFWSIGMETFEEFKKRAEKKYLYLQPSLRPATADCGGEVSSGSVNPASSGLSFPKIISGRSDDAIRLGLVWRRWSRIGSCHRLHLRHRLPHTQMFRDELGPHEHVGLLAARGTWLLAVVLAAVRRMMTVH
jgi:hypothetical protein